MRVLLDEKKVCFELLCIVENFYKGKNNEENN